MGRKAYLRVVRETVDYVLRDMTDPLGEFYNVEDAEGEENDSTFGRRGSCKRCSVAAAFGRVYDMGKAMTSKTQYPASKPIDVCRMLARDAA